MSNTNPINPSGLTGLPPYTRSPEVLAFLVPDATPSTERSVDVPATLGAVLQLVLQLGIESWRLLEPALRRDYRRHLAKDFVKLGVDTSNLSTDDDFYRLAHAYFAAEPTIKQKAPQASPYGSKEPTAAEMQLARLAAFKDIASELKLPIVRVDTSPSTRDSLGKLAIQDNMARLRAKGSLPNGQKMALYKPNFDHVPRVPAPLAKVATPKPATPKAQAIQLLLNSLHTNKHGNFSTAAGFNKAQGVYTQIKALWPKMTTAERLKIVDLACHPRSQKLTDQWNALLSKPSSSQVRKQQNQVLDEMVRVDVFRKSVGAAPSFSQVSVLRKQVAQSASAPEEVKRPKPTLAGDAARREQARLDKQAESDAKEILEGLKAAPLRSGQPPADLLRQAIQEQMDQGNTRVAFWLERSAGPMSSFRPGGQNPVASGSTQELEWCAKRKTTERVFLDSQIANKSKISPKDYFEENSLRHFLNEFQTRNGGRGECQDFCV